MAYVKISDPNIIDLNAIHNIINVVNQHSDTLNMLTNNFGTATTATTNYSGNVFVDMFDTGSQQILYGRTYFDNTSTPTTVSSPAGKIYYKSVTFANDSQGIKTFGTYAPLILVGVHTGNSSTVSNKYPDARVNSYSPTATGFSIRLFLQESIASGDKIFVNWIALGPKSK